MLSPILSNMLWSLVMKKLKKLHVNQRNFPHYKLYENFAVFMVSHKLVRLVHQSFKFSRPFFILIIHRIFSWTSRREMEDIEHCQRLEYIPVSYHLNFTMLQSYKRDFSLFLAWKYLLNHITFASVSFDEQTPGFRTSICLLSKRNKVYLKA